MKINYLFTIILVAILGVTSCKTPTKIGNEYGSATYETECMGIDPSGIQMLRTWGNGVTKAKAIEQAKRRAVETVIFKGITAGSGECNKRPLVNEVNAREKYEDYFNAFFRDGGAYQKYVTLEEKRTSRIRSKSSEMEAWGGVGKVDRTALRQRLTDDNILK